MSNSLFNRNDGTTSSSYRGNSSSSNIRSSTLSNLVIDRNRRRFYRENDSLSGSRTRSSSRTTSGNPDSSRSRSLSPSSENTSEKTELNKTQYRRKRFLQRWEDDDSIETPETNNDSEPSNSDSSSLPYVYQQPELIRISQDIIRKCEAEGILTEFFKTLDRGDPFDLSLISDQQLRKKLRHLSKALYLERNGSEFKRPPECKVSLFEVFRELLPFIKSKANSQGPYQRKVHYPEPQVEDSDKDSKRKLTKEEASELLSLREMHEQGFFVDYENVQKEFMKKQKEVELWGKTAEEQRAILSSGEAKETVEQPWRVFNREKEFLSGKKSTNSDYNSLLNSTRNFEESFNVVSKSTSFMNVWMCKFIINYILIYGSMTNYSDKYLKEFYAIGIEGSANKLGIGIIRGDGEILSNVRRTYSPPDGEGFLPRHVSKHHRENMASLLKESLEVAGIKLSQLSLICYTKGPGMGSGLHVGALASKTIHFLTGSPIVGVNHCVAHVEMGRFLSGYKNPCILYVSGGNTQVLSYDKNLNVYSVLGETLDIAIGNVLDRIARLLYLPNKPAPGLSIELLARKSTENLIPLPFVVKGMDCSFSGLLTKCESLIDQLKFKLMMNEDSAFEYESFKIDLCYSVQEHAFAMLLEMLERAMAFTGSDEILLVGGVGCNLRLQEMASKMALDRGAKLFPMDERYCIDNGAMIGYTGMIDYLYGLKSKCVLSPKEVTFSQRYRTDQAPVHWINM